MGNSKSKKIWIDLDNSPHILFFDPIITELQQRGIEVVVTARDYAQVIPLCKLFNLKYRKVGKHYGKHFFSKLYGLAFRAFQLFFIMIFEKPNLALSHGSRAQLIASKLLGVESVMAYDYELAKGLPFFKPDIKMIPDVIPNSKINTKVKKIIKYPGIKEDVYIHRFKTDSTIVEKLHLCTNKIIITIRPPASSAHYYISKSGDLFNETIDYISNLDNTQLVITPRTDEQRSDISRKWKDLVKLNKIVIPNVVVDGLNLIWHSDLVISGGGTMIREAAALGVPAYSIFQSEIGSVDKYLVSEGRLVLINSREDVVQKIKIVERSTKNEFTTTKSKTLTFIVDNLENILN